MSNTIPRIFSVFLTLTFVLLLSAKSFSVGTDSTRSFMKFPIIAGIQFQNFALPFGDMSSNFSHPGFFGGSEISYNQSNSLLQQGMIGFYRNREIGNGIFVNTQFCYRPKLAKELFGELKGGVGILRVFHPTQAYRYENGTWEEISGGKTQLYLPFEFGFGYSFDTSIGKVSPFASYQIGLAFFYNLTLPYNFYTSFLFGCRINLLK